MLRSGYTTTEITPASPSSSDGYVTRSIAPTAPAPPAPAIRAPPAVAKFDFASILPPEEESDVDDDPFANYVRPSVWSSDSRQPPGNDLESRDDYGLYDLGRSTTSDSFIYAPWEPAREPATIGHQLQDAVADHPDSHPVTGSSRVSKPGGPSQLRHLPPGPRASESSSSDVDDDPFAYPQRRRRRVSIKLVLPPRQPRGSAAGTGAPVVKASPQSALEPNPASPSTAAAEPVPTPPQAPPAAAPPLSLESSLGAERPAVPTANNAEPVAEPEPEGTPGPAVPREAASEGFNRPGPSASSSRRASHSSEDSDPFASYTPPPADEGGEAPGDLDPDGQAAEAAAAAAWEADLLGVEERTDALMAMQAEGGINAAEGAEDPSPRGKEQSDVGDRADGLQSPAASGEETEDAMGSGVGTAGQRASGVEIAERAGAEDAARANVETGAGSEVGAGGQRAEERAGAQAAEEAVVAAAALAGTQPGSQVEVDAAGVVELGAGIPEGSGPEGSDGDAGGSGGAADISRSSNNVSGAVQEGGMNAGDAGRAPAAAAEEEPVPERSPGQENSESAGVELGKEGITVVEGSAAPGRDGSGAEGSAAGDRSSGVEQKGSVEEGSAAVPGRPRPQQGGPGAEALAAKHGLQAVPQPPGKTSKDNVVQSAPEQSRGRTTAPGEVPGRKEGAKVVAPAAADPKPRIAKVPPGDAGNGQQAGAVAAAPAATAKQRPRTKTAGNTPAADGKAGGGEGEVAAPGTGADGGTGGAASAPAAASAGRQGGSAAASGRKSSSALPTDGAAAPSGSASRDRSADGVVKALAAAPVDKPGQPVNVTRAVRRPQTGTPAPASPQASEALKGTSTDEPQAAGTGPPKVGAASALTGPDAGSGGAVARRRPKASAGKVASSALPTDAGSSDPPASCSQPAGEAEGPDPGSSRSADTGPSAVGPSSGTDGVVSAAAPAAASMPAVSPEVRGGAAGPAQAPHAPLVLSGTGCAAVKALRRRSSQQGTSVSAESVVSRQGLAGRSGAAGSSGSHALSPSVFQRDSPEGTVRPTRGAALGAEPGSGRGAGNGAQTPDGQSSMSQVVVATAVAAAVAAIAVTEASEGGSSRTSRGREQRSESVGSAAVPSGPGSGSGLGRQSRLARQGPPSDSPSAQPPKPSEAAQPKALPDADADAGAPSADASAATPPASAAADPQSLPLPQPASTPASEPASANQPTDLLACPHSWHRHLQPGEEPESAVLSAAALGTGTSTEPAAEVTPAASTGGPHPLAADGDCELLLQVASPPRPRCGGRPAGSLPNRCHPNGLPLRRPTGALPGIPFLSELASRYPVRQAPPNRPEVAIVSGQLYLCERLWTAVMGRPDKGRAGAPWLSSRASTGSASAASAASAPAPAAHDRQAALVTGRMAYQASRTGSYLERRRAEKAERAMSVVQRQQQLQQQQQQRLSSQGDSSVRCAPSPSQTQQAWGSQPCLDSPQSVPFGATAAVQSYYGVPGGSQGLELLGTRTLSQVGWPGAVPPPTPGVRAHERRAHVERWLAAHGDGSAESDQAPSRESSAADCSTPYAAPAYAWHAPGRRRDAPPASARAETALPGSAGAWRSGALTRGGRAAGAQPAGAFPEPPQARRSALPLAA